MAISVYIVTEWWAYEGDTIIEVFSSDKLATEYLNSLPDYQPWFRGQQHGYDVIEKEVHETSISESKGEESPEVGKG